MATLLSCFDILPNKDENGEDIVPSEEMTLGAIVSMSFLHLDRMCADSTWQCSGGISVLHTTSHGI